MKSTWHQLVKYVTRYGRLLEFGLGGTLNVSCWYLIDILMYITPNTVKSCKMILRLFSE